MSGVNFRQPLAGDARLVFQRRRRSEGHGDWAAMPRLDLALHIKFCRTRDMRSRPGSVHGEEWVPLSIASRISS